MGYRELREESPCFGCLCRNVSEENQATNDEDEENQATNGEDEETDQSEDSRIIVKKVVQGDGNPPGHQTDFDCSFRSKHPKTDIVINEPEKSREDNDESKCLEIQSRSSQRAMTVGQRHFDEETVFPVILPTVKEDESREELHPWDEESMKDSCVSIQDVSNSTQICSICLEEYKFGESIGWSRNSECHHAFHKECIIQWLETNSDCPICRKRY